MRHTHLNETFSVLGLDGCITARSDSSVVIDFGNQGFATLLTKCEGPFECTITLAAPALYLDDQTIQLAKLRFFDLFELDPATSCRVRCCNPLTTSPISDLGPVRSGRSMGMPYGGQPYMAQLIGHPGSQWDNPERQQITFENFVRVFISDYRWDRPPEDDIYSVPKRFDLAAMFSISVAFAVLFAIMSALRASPLLISSVAVFFTTVGIAQAILFQGEKPREASIIVGAVVGFVFSLIVGTIELGPSFAILMTLASLLWAPLAGYLAGTVNGGIWLVTDYLRQWLENRTQQNAKSKATEQLRGPFDDLPNADQQA